MKQTTSILTEYVLEAIAASRSPTDSSSICPKLVPFGGKLKDFGMR